MKLTKLFGWLVVVLVGIYFWRSLARNWEQVQQLNIGITYQAIVATTLFAVAVIVSGYLWGKVFRHVSSREVPYTEAVRAHLAAWILKYIPGQVGAYIYKLKWGESQGVTKATTTVAFAYEMLFLTLASTVLVIPILLLTTGDMTGTSLLGVYVLILAGLFVFTRKSLNHAIILLVKKISGRTVGSARLLSLLEITRFSGWFTLSRIINAVGFVVLATAVVNVEPSAYIPLGAAYVLAGIVGIYAFFVPSGLGVREAVIVAFASVYFTVEEAIVLSLLARLYATVADGIVALLYVYLTKRNKSSDKIEIV